MVASSSLIRSIVFDPGEPHVGPVMFENSGSGARYARLMLISNYSRTFTVSVLNIADGASPAQHLRALRPAARFTVI
jgi:hypothetical protein